jgi:hypothetical protein
MISNPDHFPKGTRVELSAEGRREEIAKLGAKGVVTSKYPLCQIVTVQWDYKKSRDRIHVDFLKRVANA